MPGPLDPPPQLPLGDPSQDPSSQRLPLQRLPLRRLEVEALDLGEGVRAVGCELVELETREPVTGPDAAQIWSAVLRALAAKNHYTVDFFAHLRRVRDFCVQHEIRFDEPNPHVLVIPALAPEKLTALFERFADSTFGVRAASAQDQAAPDQANVQTDPTLFGGLAERGVDAYQAAYPRYLFCAVCDFESGFLTLLSERLWASEVIRRARAALADLSVNVTRPA